MRNTRRISSACIPTPFHLVYRGLRSSRRMIRMIRMIGFGRFRAIDELRLFDTGTSVHFEFTLARFRTVFTVRFRVSGGRLKISGRGSWSDILFWMLIRV